MRKRLLFLFSALFFCFGFSNVYASTKLGINFDSHEHFNYFYEQKNNTPFYNLYQSGNLDSWTNWDSTNYKYIFYYSDITLNSMSSSFQRTLTNDIKYVVITSSTAPGLHRGNGYQFGLSSDTSNYDSIHPRHFYFFNENAEIVTHGSYAYDSDIQNYSINTMSFNLNNTSDESMADLSYMLSISYNYDLFTSSTDYVVTDLLVDGEHYLIDDNDNYSNFLARLRQFFSFGGINGSIDAVDSGLEWFKTFPIDNNNKFPCLKTITDYSKRLEIPNGYESVILDNNNTSYLFFPKDINNNDLKRTFYTHVTDFNNYENISIWLNTYNKSTLKTPYDSTRLKKITYKKPNTLYKVNVDSILKKEDETYNVTNFITSFSLQTWKYKSSIHYNPNAFSVCVYKETTATNTQQDNTCTYINSAGNEVTLSHDDMYNILSSNDSIGAVVNIEDSADSQRETASQYSEIYDYDEEGNITNFNLSSVFKGVSSFFTGFTSVLATMFSYTTLLFSFLPIEIRSVLLFSLVGGALVIIFKFMRG